MNLAKIEVDDFGGSPVATHNFPCPVCHKNHAVYWLTAYHRMSGTFSPCWSCQNIGWMLIKVDCKWIRKLISKWFGTEQPK